MSKFLDYLLLVKVQVANINGTNFEIKTTMHVNSMNLHYMITMLLHVKS